MKPSKNLEFYGGSLVALVPVLVLIGGLAWISLAKSGGTAEFWVFAWLGLVIGIVFAKDRTAYCESTLNGLTDRGGVTVIVAWLFAGVLGKVMVAGGLVDGILWIGTTFDVGPALFVVLTFVASMIFAVGTGTSTGTALALAPILYPAGVFLGADPVATALAILSGGVFGDNLAPISDSTIVSASTQEASIKDVVRSRFPLAMSAAAFTVVALWLMGQSGGSPDPVAINVPAEPAALLMLVGLVVVIVSALLGRHIIESMIWGILSSVVAGLLIGGLTLGQLVHVPETRGQSTGLIQDGLATTQNAIIFVLLLLALTQVVVDSGIMSRFLSFLERSIITTVRQAELAIVGVSVAISIPMSSNAPAELIVGPSIVKPLGAKFHLSPARKANLMDCAVCSVFYLLPWHIAVMVWHAAIVEAAEHHGIYAPEISIAFLNPYAWAILAVIVFSAWTGWNRRFEDGYERKAGAEPSAFPKAVHKKTIEVSR